MTRRRAGGRRNPSERRDEEVPLPSVQIRALHAARRKPTWQSEFVSLSDRLRGLDNRALGKPVPDDRPLAERLLLHPRRAVWSGKGSLIYGATTLAMLGVARWVSNFLIAGCALIALFVVGLLVSFADERKRSRTFYGDSD
jgi:hypothetical protein